MSASESADRVQVGRVIGLWGVHGWLRVYSDTQPPERIFSYRPWLLGAGYRAYDVLDWKRQGPRLMVRLAGIEDADQASALIDQSIHIERSSLPPPEEGSYYWSDLVGLEVVNLQGYGYGQVHRLIETGANDVLDVRSGDGAATLIPFVSGQVVHGVDFDTHRITVDWPVEWTQ